MTFQNFVRQPTTVAGIAAMFGTIQAVLLGHLTWWQALPLLSGSAIAIVLPDNTGAKSDTETLVRAAESLGHALLSTPVPSTPSPPSSEQK